MNIKAILFDFDGTLLPMDQDLFLKYYFGTLAGKDCRKDEPVFDSFYRNEFVAAKNACQQTLAAKEIINLIKESGKRLILATNPIFPAVATENRIAWAGLSTGDFELITTYENSSYCKPNPKYYTEIFEKTGLAPEECLINKKNGDISKYPQGGFEELKEYLRNIL